MKEVTRSYVLEIIKIGSVLHGGKAAFERAACLPKGHIKDIEKWGKMGKSQGTEIPRADRWQRMLEAAQVNENGQDIIPEEADRIIGEINMAFKKIGARIENIEKKISPPQDALNKPKIGGV